MPIEIQTEPLAQWVAATLGEHLRSLQPLSGGNSNETMLLQTDAGLRILRRPPAAQLGHGAHSMEREFRVLRALEHSDVPAPRALALCEDDRVFDVPFLVMEHVPGVALTVALPDGWGEDAVGEVGFAVIDALARMHTAPWRELGLEGYGQPDGFLDRQVARWRRQYEAREVRDLPRFRELARWLEENRPPASPPAIIHGDFHADNCLVTQTRPARVAAIIDWEMSTIGDPLIDLGLLLGFWGRERPAPRAMPIVQGFSHVDAAPSRRALAERYEELTGRSVQHLPYYMALAFWKLGAIVEGAYALLVAGDVDSEYARKLAADVPLLFEEAAGFAGLG